ncbi:hypothetical protein CP10139811_0715 [Chlamydia ibidis]|uniref:Uncharacterized protein n=2 Tax=Chlamydia ibidis TaxID=1405396 RepID=S7KK69_9CHLA|nr:hypothetical protein [Chlamydia ibidis]EPP34815.1 hypothetical protein CP10139811_0715 [Chlamydia ibidis]EQM63015.1 hypothetical protein H359_0036 [Chlamydia ibidis 10-1398/6]
MNESIQTVSFSKTHRLTAKATVSLEMPLATHSLHQEGMPETRRLEDDFLRAEAILTEMQEIRCCLERSLDNLVPRS